MIDHFIKEHPWLYRNFLKKRWKLLSSFSPKFIRTFSKQLECYILLFPGSTMSQKIYINDYESETTNFLSKIIKKGDCIYDIGANVGFYSLFFSRLVGENGQVHAFEPSLRETAMLSQNIINNQIQNVSINQCAVSDKTGYLWFNVFSRSEDGVYNSLGEINHPTDTGKLKQRIQIRTIQLDDYLASFKNIPYLIKADTEGAETLLLQGAQKLIKSLNAPILVLEENQVNLKGFGISVQDFRHQLSSFGYKIYQIKLDGSLSEMQLNEDACSINIVALKDFHIAKLKEKIHWST